MSFEFIYSFYAFEADFGKTALKLKNGEVDRRLALKKTNEKKAKSQTNKRTYLLAADNLIKAHETALWPIKFNKTSFSSILRLIT